MAGYTVSDIGPSSPSVGDKWIKPGLWETKTWDGTEWVLNGFKGLNKITVAAVAPGSPSVGDLWCDTS